MPYIISTIPTFARQTKDQVIYCTYVADESDLVRIKDDIICFLFITYIPWADKINLHPKKCLHPTIELCLVKVLRIDTVYTPATEPFIFNRSRLMIDIDV